ncbi:non-ribosomal peptide synthetase [Actinophytocola xinjiangensis]|uniref:Non-ribosomal peptide synthetase n=1 Tax=Actinophytocola xinjiangensis TaxID=485602 RepID=A0A7Z1AYR3_9PSEU|nr:non-ribosomal peptide synthetase [Actinophytocola xinjiangensis]OLF10148.1 non-ribosomal peptide synthetase [Actinophytocola xinjiangensis]
MVEKDDIESISGLAAMQKGMLFSHVVDTGSDAYVEQFDFTIAGEIDAGHLRTALAGVSRTYGVLRSLFSFRNTDEPYQIVLRERDPEWRVLDVRPSADPAAEVDALKAADRARGFDLAREVLLRATLVRVADRRWRLVLTFHHIVLDGWSLGPLFATMMGYYDELTSTGTYRQKSEALPYSEYIAWYENQHDTDARRHWADALEGYETAAVLPTTERPGGYQGASHRFTLPAGLYEGLRGFARDAKVTQNAVFQAAWGVVLQKFNHTDDVVFGSVVSGRGTALPGVGEAVGLFCNTQPVRVRTSAGQDFTGLCRDVQDAYLRANAYEHFALHEIQALTSLRTGLLDHVVAFENYPLSDQLQEFGGDEGDDDLAFEGVEVFERTSYDLHIVVNPGREFAVTFVYNENAYAPELMATLERSLLRVLTAAVADPAVPVAGLALADAPARHTAATASPRLGSTLPAVFAEVVARHGERTALTWQGRHHTYRDLDAWSDAIARRLTDLGVAPGDPVGVLADRRPELVAAFLGVLKTGAFYVPIDTKDADPRVGHILADAGARHLCTVTDFAPKAPASVEVLLVDPPTGDVPAFTGPATANADTAYLMYTSGSTGAPKGCGISHRNILRLVTDQTFFDFSAEQVVMFTGSPAFDSSTFEIWGTLLHGGTLVLAEELDVLDGDRMRAMITASGVRSMWLTSPLFNQLCDQDPTIFASLEHLLVGGSALSVPHLATVRAACPGLVLTNGYGPTENTTFSTTHRVRPADLERGRIPIGVPLAHSTAHVLDRALNPLPPGAVGELCVGGDGVSAGYHRQPELTAQRFVTVPALPGERLYRTGDLVRELPDGTFDYLGRADDQVKISGFRIELGEVEHVVRALPGVRDVSVICVENAGEKSLRGFYTTDSGLTPDQVRQGLAANVAPYLVPAELVALESLPLNKSGKVDRAALAAIRPAAPTPASAAELSGLSEMERVVYDALADLVPSGAVDVRRNFFDLGINSLNLLTINNRLRKALDRDLPLVLYFEHTSIAALAAHLASGGTDQAEPDAPAPDEEEEQELVLATSRLLLDLHDDPEM